MKNYYRCLDSYLKSKYGEKVYKIALDGGMTCPNRDGRIGYGGCIFCSQGGSGDFAVKNPDAAIELIKAHGKRTGEKYIAYFQSYSNTYAPVDYLRNLFMPVIQREDIVGLAIGTRPDCLPEDVLNLLDELNKIKPIWVELGLQTVNEKTVEYIRRGYKNPVFEEAVSNLRKHNIDVIVHLILGLPGEDKNDMLNSVKYINSFDIQGIKFQQLYVLENTDLAVEYKKGNVKILSFEEYIEILHLCINELREDIVIHRLTGDGPKNQLIAPDWSRNKKAVLNRLNREFIKL